MVLVSLSPHSFWKLKISLDWWYFPQWFSQVVEITQTEIVQILSRPFQEAFLSQSVPESHHSLPFTLEACPRKLTPKEVAKIVYQSFRFSQGSIELQFSMLYQAFQYFWSQEVDIKECEQKFVKMLKVGKKYSETFVNSGGISITVAKWVDMGLSSTGAHKRVSADNLEEMTGKYGRANPFISMLLTWKGHIERYDRDGSYSVSKIRRYENILWILSAMVEQDMKYIFQVEKRYGVSSALKDEYVWRPDRFPENDGKNNQLDRFFSYFVWYIVKWHKTWDDFFDKYFSLLRWYFKDWIASLPTKSRLKSSEISLRDKIKSTSRSSRDEVITQEDIADLLAFYNSTHSNSLVMIDEVFSKTL